MAKTVATRSMEPAAQYGGLYLVKGERASVREPAQAPLPIRVVTRAYPEQTGNDLMPVAFGALALPLLWALTRLLHAMHR